MRPKRFEVARGVRVQWERNIFPGQPRVQVNRQVIYKVGWLQEKVEDWPSCPLYKKLMNFISKMSVVNNGSERGVELIQEYIDSACYEDLIIRYKILSKQPRFKNINKQ